VSDQRRVIAPEAVADEHVEPGEDPLLAVGFGGNIVTASSAAIAMVTKIACGVEGSGAGDVGPRGGAAGGRASGAGMSAPSPAVSTDA
jgi:hypothetical protein